MFRDCVSKNFASDLSLLSLVFVYPLAMRCV